MKKATFEELKQNVCTSSDTLYHVCQRFISFVKQKDESERTLYLQEFLANIQLKDFGDKLQPSFFVFDISDPRFKESLAMENRIVSNMIESHVEEAAFYQALSDKLNDDVLLPSSDDKALFLMVLWQDARIPYYKLEQGLILDNDTYKNIIAKLKEPLSKAGFILSTKLDYKTQRSSLLLAISKELNSEEEVVFWAVILDQQRRQIQLLQELLEEYKKQNEYLEESDSDVNG